MRTYGSARKAIYNHDFSKAYVATLSARELVNLEAEARERQRFDVLAWVAASLRKASPRAEVVAAELAQEVAQLGQGVEFVEDGYDLVAVYAGQEVGRKFAGSYSRKAAASAAKVESKARKYADGFRPEVLDVAAHSRDGGAVEVQEHSKVFWVKD